MQRIKGGIIGLLEVIETDFVRLEADTQANERQAAQEYSRFMADSEVDIKTKHDREFKLTLQKDQEEFNQEQLQKDLDVTLDQLNMARAYFEELKPQCLLIHVSFEKRAARRQEEI